jgi:hypothetical protein
MNQTTTPEPEERSPEAAQSCEDAQRRADACFWENYQRRLAERCEDGRLRHEADMRALSLQANAELEKACASSEAVAEALSDAIGATRAATVPESARYERRLTIATLLRDISKLAGTMALVYQLPNSELPQMAETLRKQASEAFDLINAGGAQ